MEDQKLRIIISEEDMEDRYTKFKKILNVYNHKTKHNTNARNPEDIFLYAGTPNLNMQENKESKINKLNEKRQNSLQTITIS